VEHGVAEPIGREPLLRALEYLRERGRLEGGGAEAADRPGLSLGEQPGVARKAYIQMRTVLSSERSKP